MKFFLASLIVSLATPTQTLTEQRVSSEYNTCIKKLPELAGHWDQTQCMADEVDRQKALLNIEYKALVRKTDKRDKAALEKAQKAWLAFREVECEAKADAIDHAGGNGAWDASVSCLLQHVLLRRDQLKNYWAL